MSHDQVMQIMGVDDLDSLIDPGFLSEFGLKPPGQYGMVCRDVPAKQRELEAAGARPFVYGRTKGPNWCEYPRGTSCGASGESGDVRIEVALGYSGHQQIELLGPGRNTDFYLEKIPKNGSLALHHVCVLQKGLDKLEQRLNEAGFATVLSGHTDSKVFSTRFKYFETRPQLGFYLEITEYLLFGCHAPPGETVISALGAAQQRFGKQEAA